MINPILDLPAEGRQPFLESVHALFDLSALLEVLLHMRQQLHEIQQRQQCFVLVAHPRQIVLQHLQPSQESGVGGSAARDKEQLRVLHNITSKYSHIGGCSRWISRTR